MSCPFPPGNEHYPVPSQDRNGNPILVCAKCQKIIG